MRTCVHSWERLTLFFFTRYDKLECVYIFRHIFMLYLLAPTFLLVVQIMILTWRYNWLMAVMIEILNIVIYYKIHTAVYVTGTNPFEVMKHIFHIDDPVVVDGGVG